MADWSKLPEELLRMIAVRSYSSLEFKRFRSICTAWRNSAFRSDNPHTSRAFIKFDPLVLSVRTHGGLETISGLGQEDHIAFISRTSFFRVTLSASSSSSTTPNQSWLIKSNVDINLGTIHLLLPLSRFPLTHSYKWVDILKFTVTEIGQGYLAQYFRSLKPASGFKKVILAGGREERVLAVGCDGKIRYWNGEIWTRIKDQTGEFLDIIVYRGVTYALDTNGNVWWISSSSLRIFKYGALLAENIANEVGSDMSLMGCDGELYVVERLLETNLRKRKADNNTIRPPPTGFFPTYHSVIHDDFGNERCKLPGRNNHKTVGFKVYKMDVGLRKWVQVNSLEGNAVFMATDACFSVVANEYYGCLPDTIYCVNQVVEDIQVFELDDGNGSVVDPDQISFEMFAPPFSCKSFLA